jgi:membrane protease YdiL (CAAX protease family)
MGWLYWKSGSLWLPVWMHFINNGLAYALTWYIGNDSASFKDLMPGGSVYLLVCIASVCIFLLSFKMLSEKKLSSHETFRK